MIDLTWKIFSQTGNIETYLLLKELENATFNEERGQAETESIQSMDTNI
ncbi:YqzL family protein [Oceanobacillus massiliensis]|nr:YqzL family protein [Oceanobacillus massiliensis]